MGWEKMAFCSTKVAISMKRVKIEKKLLWGAYRNSPSGSATGDHTVSAHTVKSFKTCKIHTTVRKVPGWYEKSMVRTVRKVHGWYEKSMERNVHGTESPPMVRNVYGTNSLWYEKSGNRAEMEG